jgi:hypothetical protein
MNECMYECHLLVGDIIDAVSGIYERALASTSPLSSAPMSTRRTLWKLYLEFLRSRGSSKSSADEVQRRYRVAFPRRTRLLRLAARRAMTAAGGARKRKMDDDHNGMDNGALKQLRTPATPAVMSGGVGVGGLAGMGMGGGVGVGVGGAGIAHSPRVGGLPPHMLPPSALQQPSVGASPYAAYSAATQAPPSVGGQASSYAAYGQQGGQAGAYGSAAASPQVGTPMTAGYDYNAYNAAAQWNQQQQQQQQGYAQTQAYHQ